MPKNLLLLYTTKKGRGEREGQGLPEDRRPCSSHLTLYVRVWRLHGQRATSGTGCAQIVDDGKALAPIGLGDRRLRDL